MSLKAGADALVAGGGFFGCSLALALARQGSSVELWEAGDALFQGASYHNQARVHHGYHYPRSPLTGQRSSESYGRFLRDYADCVPASNRKLYAVARRQSQVTALQFEAFCRRIQAPLSPAAPADAALFDREQIEKAWSAEEAVFDAARLRRRLQRELEAAGVRVRLGCGLKGLSAGPSGPRAEGMGREGAVSLDTQRSYLCLYAGSNAPLQASGLPLIPLRVELAEMALVQAPPVFDGLGLTVMCGPFFSVMPFPDKGLHTLSHVRYTPHFALEEGPGLAPAPRGEAGAADEPSAFEPMLADALRYVPALRGSLQRGSLWAWKALLPMSEGDDSRPILCRKDHGLKGLQVLLGGKIDNVYDMLAELGLNA